ncbi:MAG: sulfatase-like hydrolase/transferase [Sedimentisphaeraceae bacterium JB056]
MQKKQAIVIMSDTQRRDMLGCYYGDNVRTPNLDRLASEGMLFERAYCCDPVCGPARSAIFSGTYPHTNGIWSNGFSMGTDIPTIGQRLSKDDIYSAYIGKWHIDGAMFGHGKAPEGWASEWWFDARNHLEQFSDEERLMLRNAESSGKVPEDMCFANHCTGRALKFIDENKDKDFLLVVSYKEPHHPWLAPEPFASMFDNDDIKLDNNTNIKLDDNIPELKRLWGQAYVHNIPNNFIEQKKRFLACNAYVDYEIGKLLNSIDDNCPEALTIYTADHGFSLGNRMGLYDKGPAVYEEIIGVPLLIRKKGMISSNTRYKNPVSHIDLTPTILDFMGCKSSPVLEGKSMLPILKDSKVPHKSEVFVEFGRFTMAHDGYGGFNPYRCCITEDYKLCINLLDKDELYNIKEDPDEVVNLISVPEYAEIRNQLHDRILEWMGETRDCFRGYHWERRPWRTDARPASYHYTRTKRYKRGDPGFTPEPLDYSTGLPISNYDQKVTY